MAKFLVEQSGPLSGEVVISGAKNAVLPIMAASVLSGEKCIIRDVPDLRDVGVMREILSYLGGETRYLGSNTIEINMENLDTYEADPKLVEKMRASILIMGPLLARKGYAKVYMPGGCTIGKRPVDLHLKGFEGLGAVISVNAEEGYIEAEAPKDGLKGASIYLDFPSVGATENIMTAAVLSKGTTYIENAAKEPEIVDLANFLNKMGAKIKGAGTDTVKIEGVASLKGASHCVIPDRIETGTFMLAAAITRGAIHIKNVVPDHVKPISAKLTECGVTVETRDDGMFVCCGERKLEATDIKTLPYPGFPTDIQSPFMAFLTTVEGESSAMETVFENRFMHVVELNRMGADIETEDRRAIIRGPKKLIGTDVRATDLRAGAAMVLAGLVAEGTTEISDIYHIERGYENFVEKFESLGGKIRKIQ